ncbi:contractile injection system protein, VgrG/Pvc8 family [Microbulbifer sp. THAF38]|uniref:contractile injection system protein, VgrG/Pvc8 family n=1 Tax=Microbulbifer sp. THAF38 TaxID=2587856 RepID=UPI001267FE82|nr:contractile injection system protein, VgrG/Pvc8 family [Microbulbifer sp. THAF38]QFT56587.1 Phage late control gene D protein (GPD) [Microbulbifer sp. THAF38]
MLPRFVLEVEGIERRVLNQRALGFTWVDKAGHTSDTLSIILDDAEGRLAIPRKGVSITAKLGYDNDLQIMPKFVVDEIELSGPHRQMTITARASNLHEKLKTHKSRSWDNLTLNDLITEICKDNDLTPIVASSLIKHKFHHLDQTNESDMNFLTRLAIEMQAIAKVVGDRLIFVPVGEAKSASGKKLLEVPVSSGECDNWRFTLPDRGRFSGVEARWHDPITATEQLALAGDRSGAVERLPQIKPGRADAESAADARLRFLKRQNGKLSFTVDGNPNLRAKTPLRLNDFHQQIDGMWTVDQATHSIGKNQRYTTQVQAASEE